MIYAFNYVVITLDEADSGSFGQTAPTFKRIFELLSCHRMDDAVKVAEKAGMFRLATLLSQLDGDASLPTLMRNQLETWRCSEADKTIPADLLKIYRLLAGSVLVEDEMEVTDSIVLGLGWVRAIGILFWYCSKETLLDTVGTLAGAVESYQLCGSALVDPPVSSYVKDTDPLGADVITNTKHGLYSLLELLFPDSSNQRLTEAELNAELNRKIVASLLPAGYTRDALDYRTSYLILAVLESAGVADEQASYACIVRQHLIFQLLSFGLWKWAVFIALQLKDVHARYSLSRDIVLRFAGCRDWELVEDDSSAEKFLSHRVNIPQVWIYEATAYRLGYEFDRFQQAMYLIDAKQWDHGKEILCIYVAPKAILASSSVAAKLLSAFESMEEREQEELRSEGLLAPRYTNTYATLSAIFVAFLRLRDFVESVRDSDLEVQKVEGVIEINTKLDEMLQEAKSLLHRLANYQSKQAVNQEIGTESIYRNAVLYDMSNYLYRLISKLVSLRSSPEGQEGKELLHLVSSEYLHGIPVHGDSVSKTLGIVSEEHLHEAAHRLMMAN